MDRPTASTRRKNFNMPDPSRIPIFLDTLRTIWMAHPYLRFYQLVLNSLPLDQTLESTVDSAVEDTEALSRFLDAYGMQQTVQEK